MEAIASWQNGVLDPHGPIAAAERTILLNASIIMLAVIVPVIVLTLGFAWWFREGNRSARRSPDWAFSGPIEVTVWSIPILVILFLGGIAWIGSRDLEPSRPLASPVVPLDVQVVSLDWKWLFIYPQQGVASVNVLVVPAATPLHLHLTSGSVMNSFFIPQIGSQIYTMAGMTTTLNLQADGIGTFEGLSAQFSGDGFSDMRFDTVAIPANQFADWVAKAHSNPGVLDATQLAVLSRPGTMANSVIYGRISPRLFETIVASFSDAHAASSPMAMSSRSD